MVLYTEIITNNLASCLMLIRDFIQQNRFLAKSKLFIQIFEIYTSIISPHSFLMFFISRHQQLFSYSAINSAGKKSLTILTQFSVI